MNSIIKIRPVLFISLLVLVACKGPEVDHTKDSKPISVIIEKVEATSYQVPVRVSGILATTKEMKLSFKTGGILSQLNTREGLEVRAGEILAVLDLSEIRAQVYQAEIGFEKSIRDKNRARNLYQDSVVTLEQYQNAVSAYELAKSQKQIADFNMQHSRIKAPTDGKIMRILVEANEMIGPGYPAILFASTENDWVVRAAITDKDIVKLSIGDSALISMDAFPGIKFPAEVSELASGADPLTGSYEAEMKIRESHKQFRTGYFSRADIFPAESKHALVVPLEALVNASDRKAHVFVYSKNGNEGEMGTATKRPVDTGRILGDRVVVLNGLTEGEWIVSGGAKFLRTDMEVRGRKSNESSKR